MDAIGIVVEVVVMGGWAGKLWLIWPGSEALARKGLEQMSEMLMLLLLPWCAGLRMEDVDDWRGLGN